MRGIALGALLAGALCAQPRFEVASVRPAAEAEVAKGSSGIQTGRSGLNARNVTLKRCIVGAYAVGPNQIAGGPDWLDTAHFDIQAKPAEPTDDDALLMQMLQTLLAERFQLVIRREQRTAKVYLLEVVKNGPRLVKSAPATATNTNGAHGRLEATGTTMPDFARHLSRVLDLPAVDRTGLEGAFDLKLRWTPEGDKVRPDSPPGIFTALLEQLGLRLTGGRAPVDTIAIVSAAMPSEN